jgi:hypothetical protein
MTTDDFFTKIDAQLKKDSGLNVDAATTAAKNRQFLEQVIARLNPTVSTYVSKLKKRGINVEIDQYPTEIRIRLRYKSGDYQGLSIGEDVKSNRIELRTLFREDRKSYISSDTTYDQSNWEDSIFMDSLQRLIEDFVSSANKHGGI